MPANADLLAFIRGSFRSIWSMELLLLLKSDPARFWPPGELVAALRGSDAVVAQSLASLVAAGLVLEEKDDRVRYAPATDEIAALANQAETYYASKPDAVRRLIVQASQDQLRAFSDAFRLRKD
ncbi:helix-turn-helix transcriptional regulator [Allosphingosinicella flava]|uniref:Helix-turn-helix transcriptional regulator n=1 Tax=Allosphingosinicella flava TaxID=2771430 RepID=A0A7T2GJK0_9SPHN|nr:helix-turn-helix domain-containing protein [Sphingosinicella flava]QPQ55050.1 helix-turn-helix transcriptional regulator [Sphingosinicella flava]